MSAPRGRPRNFDADTALERALGVFWKHGFQDASLHELTEAMGLSKPSLYATFGDKEALYLKALERYVAMLFARHGALLSDEADARCAVEAFLRSMARMLTDPALPGGCFIINGSADCGGATTPASVELALRAALQGSEAMLHARLERALADGQLPAAPGPEALAALFSAILAGLAVQAKSGASQVKLDSAIDAALALLPRAKTG